MKEKLESNQFCFVCGQENPRGLRVKIQRNKDERFIRIALDSTFEGYKGVVHGGILVSLMDEVMAYAVSDDNYWGITASLEVKFRKVVSSQKTIIVSGKALEKKRLWAKGEARIRYENEEDVLAEAEGLFKLIPNK